MEGVGWAKAEKVIAQKANVIAMTVLLNAGKVTTGFIMGLDLVKELEYNSVVGHASCAP
jgi:hypothetical protein